MSSNHHCQQPVFDSHPPDLYGSLGAEASQRNAGSFLQAESLAPQVEEGTSPAGSQNTSTYMSLRNREREPSNEYDYIPGGDPTLEPRLAIAPTETRGEGGTLESREPADSGTSRGSSRKVTKNSMYENHDIKPLLHPTLTGHEEGVEGVGVREGERCTCSTKSLVQAFFLAMTMLLAIASLGLSGLMWFGVNDNESPTDTTSLPVYTPEMTECSCPVSIDLLREELEELRSAVKDMNTSVLEEASQLTTETNTLPVALDRVQDLASDVVNITWLFNSEPSVDVRLNVSHIYDRCETTVKASCSLPHNSALNNCTTDFVLTNSSETYVIYRVCRTRQSGSAADYTAAMASLEARDDDEAVRCSCLRLGEPTVAIDCQLAVTSCPILWDLSNGF